MLNHERAWLALVASKVNSTRLPVAVPSFVGVFPVVSSFLSYFVFFFSFFV